MFNNMDDILLNEENNFTTNGHHKPTKSEKNYINAELQKTSQKSPTTRKAVAYNVSMIIDINQNTNSPSNIALYKRIYSSFNRASKSIIRSFIQRFLPMVDFQIILLNYNNFVEIRGHVTKSHKTFVKLTVFIQDLTWIHRHVSGDLLENVIKMISKIVNNNIWFNSTNLPTVLLYRALNLLLNRTYLTTHVQLNRCILNVFKVKLKSLPNAGDLLNFTGEFDQDNTNIEQTLSMNEPLLGNTTTICVTTDIQADTILHEDCRSDISIDLAENNSVLQQCEHNDVESETSSFVSNEEYSSYINNNVNVCTDMSRALLTDRYQLHTNDNDDSEYGLEIVLSDKYNLQPDGASITELCTNNDSNTPTDFATDNCEFEDGDINCEKEMLRAAVRAILSNKYTLRPCENRDIDSVRANLHFILSDEYQLCSADTIDINIGDYEIGSDDAAIQLRNLHNTSEEEKKDSEKINTEIDTNFTYSSSATRRTNLNTRHGLSSYIQNMTRSLYTPRGDANDSASDSDTDYLEANRSPGEIA